MVILRSYGKCGPGFDSQGGNGFLIYIYIYIYIY